jgi:prepilin-type N-terminal cleavage/methylation domain-containing protein
MSSFSSTHRRSQGFTLIELLVVISIIAILAGMLLPVIGVVREMARSAQCGKNQSQILGGMFAYATSEDSGWPDPRGSAATAWKLPNGVITSATAPSFTAGAFEIMAFSQDIPNGLFKCPSAAMGGPSKTIKITAASSNVNWGWAPPAVGVSYGFDWAAPQETGSARVILADRDPKNHGMTVMACFGDTHVGKLKPPSVVVASSGSITQGLNGPVTISIENPAAKGSAGGENNVTDVIVDNIYDDVSDYNAAAGGAATDSFIPGQGDKRRAMIK